MIQIAIVDDEKQIRDMLTSYIRKYEKKSRETFSITCFEDGQEMIDKFNYQFDLIFMDIQMPNIDGMKAARVIRTMDTNVIMIFVTNIIDYAIEGYQINALSYVVKPISYLDFERQINIAVTRIHSLDKNYIILQKKSEILKLDISDILFVESVQNQLLVKTFEEEVKITRTLKSIESELRDFGFVRCNNGTLVALKHVSEIIGSEVKIGKDLIPISRGKKKEFLNKLAEYMGGVS